MNSEWTPNGVIALVAVNIHLFGNLLGDLRREQFAKFLSLLFLRLCRWGVNKKQSKEKSGVWESGRSNTHHVLGYIRIIAWI